LITIAEKLSEATRKIEAAATQLSKAQPNTSAPDPDDENKNK
jgi:hypothetical protein